MNKKDQDIIKLISKIDYNNKYDIFNSKNEVDINRIIEESLNIDSLKQSSFKHNLLRRDELLEKTKENSIINFLNDLQNKNIEEIKNLFLSKIKENSNNTHTQIEKSKNQTKEYI